VGQKREKGFFWGLAPFALLTHDSGSKKRKGVFLGVSTFCFIDPR